MERIEYRNVVDKSDWVSRGEWDNEPDKIQWQDEATGLPCLIVRGPVGSLCGYVGVADGHPAHGKDYDAIYNLMDVDVHGGLTFAASCSPNAKEERGICHKPAPGEPDHVWWLGFDCAHLGDVCPQFDRPGRYGGDSWYKNIAYVEGECRKLAQQLIAATLPTAHEGGGNG
jgi:hypothetical protein